ncbi:flagellar basal body rod protein FlgB [Gemmobacter lanyuensis]
MSEERQIAEKCEKGKYAMTLSLRDSLGVHADALVLRETRNTVLHGNISNAATPGYKARDFDFTAALRDATGRSSDLPLEGGTPRRPTGSIPRSGFSRAGVDGAGWKYCRYGRGTGAVFRKYPALPGQPRSAQPPHLGVDDRDQGRVTDGQ